MRRDFSTPDVVTQLVDSTMGTDVSAQFGRGRHGNVPFARRHLGMSRAVFQSCAFISQGEIFEVEKTAPTQIGDAIAALADSARRDVSAVRALERLDAALAKIGSDRARTADLPVAREKLGRARAELEAADESRRAVAVKAERLDELTARAARLAGERMRTEYLLHRSQAAKLRGIVAQIEAVDAEIARAREAAGAAEGAPTIAAGLRDEVIALRSRIERASEALVRAESERDSASGSVTGDDRMEYETLRVSVGRLSEEQIASLQKQAFVVAPGSSGIGAVLRTIGRALVGAMRRVVAILLRREMSGRMPFAPTVADGAQVAPSSAEAVVLLERHRRYLTLRPLIERLDSSRTAG